MMMGITNGRGFKGAIDYDRDLDGRHDKEARILSAKGVDVFYNNKGQLDADSTRLARSFRAQAMLNPAVKKCVKHIWLSYKPEDTLVMVNSQEQQNFSSLQDAIRVLGEQKVNELTDRQMTADVKELLQQLRYDNTQFLIVRHSEKNNPHVHVILNVVNIDGVRLKDFQEKKRGFEICRKITLNRHYTWGEHKSVSKTVSHDPKANIRAEICREILDISTKAKTAEELQQEAAKRNIEVRYSTDYHTGRIKGLSFSKEGFIFPAAKVDASLSAVKLFPSQDTSEVPLSSLSLEKQNIVKAGGVVPGFNNAALYGSPLLAETQKPVLQAKRRDLYYKAIERADKSKNYAAYIQHIGALAFDPLCGSSKERTEALLPYLDLKNTEQKDAISEICKLIDYLEGLLHKGNPLAICLGRFLVETAKRSLDIKKYPINMRNKTISLPELLNKNAAESVGLALEIQKSLMELSEARKHQASSQNISSENVKPKTQSTQNTEQKPKDNNNTKQKSLHRKL